ncbi:MAG TPA: hypothetical protein VGD74_11570, partial [Vulgatibacter sp.]
MAAGSGKEATESAQPSGGMGVAPGRVGSPTPSGKAGAGCAKPSKKDFQTDQDVRWCPGCGDYAILASVQKVLPELGIPREKFVFV